MILLTILLRLARMVHGCPRWVDEDASPAYCHCGAAEGEWHYGWAWDLYRRAWNLWCERNAPTWL